MAETRIADNVWWHVREEAKKQKKTEKQEKQVVQPVKKEKPPKPQSRIDARFEDWAKRNEVDLRDLPIMQKEKK